MRFSAATSARFLTNGIYKLRSRVHVRKWRRSLLALGRERPSSEHSRTAFPVCNLSRGACFRLEQDTRYPLTL